MREEEHKALTLKEQVSALKFIFQFVWREKTYLLIGIFSGILLAIINTLMPFILAEFMDKYLSVDKATTRIIFFFATLYLVTSLAKAVVWFGQWFFYEQAMVKVIARIRLTLYRKFHTLGMRYFDQKPTGWIVSRITNDTNLFEFFFVFLMGITGFFSVISAFVGLFILEAKIALIMLLFLPFLLLAVVLYQVISSRVYRRMRDKLSEINTKLNEYISGMRIIQQFRQEKRLRQEFEKSNEEYLALRKKVTQVNALLLHSLVSLLLAMAYVVALGMFGLRSFHVVVEAGIIYAFITNLNSFFQPIGQIMDFLSQYSDGLVASHRIQQIMAETQLEPEQNPTFGQQIEQGKIEFRNVTFSYDGVVDVLKNISFTVNAGETVAFVGHTGSGKSSIINVFLRFYEFGKGEILIDDKDIRTFSKEELRKKIGLVLQDTFLFVGDIKENIRMLNENITDEQVEVAAQFTQAHYFIEQLEGKYEAKVIEGGDSLSTGQKQLLNFARTIVVEPKILVLDEATANIDTETERLIQTALSNMRKNRTTIAIAHRLSTIKDANQIIVLEKGEIVERGTHDTLLLENGYYAQMYRLQVDSK